MYPAIMDNLAVNIWLKDAIDIGAATLEKNGKDVWNDFSATVPHYVFPDGWQSDFKVIYEKMKILGAMDRDECPPEHFIRHHHFIQLARIPMNKPATLVALCQVYFNSGRFFGLHQIEVYPQEWLDFIENEKLGLISTYIKV